MREFIIAVLLGLAVDVTSGQRRIQLIPENPVINGPVTLSVTGITGEILSFSWFKGPDTLSQYQILSLTYIPGSLPPVRGPQYNPRMTALSNGSLQIKDLQITDGGKYIVKIQTVSGVQDITVTLTVYEPVTKPLIMASTLQPKENNELTLTCYTEKAATITWSRRGAQISSEAKLSGDNRTLTFPSVKRGDSGEYRCEAQNLVSKKSSDPYTLSVAYIIPGNYTVGLALGLASAIILGVVLIVGSFFLYRKFAAKRLNVSLENIQEDMEIYENVEVHVKAVQVKEESAYTDLEFKSEEIYTELKTYDIASIRTQENVYSLDINGDSSPK